LRRVGPSRSRLEAPRRGDLLVGPARQGVSPGKPCGERSQAFPLARAGPRPGGHIPVPPFSGDRTVRDYRRRGRRGAWAR
jgi:hypothetical protein